MGGQRFTWCLTWDREAHLVPQRLTWWLTFDPEAHLVADWCPRGSPSACARARERRSRGAAATGSFIVQAHLPASQQELADSEFFLMQLWSGSHPMQQP